MITLVLYIGSLPNLTTWLPSGRGRILFILESLGQDHCYYKYNFWLFLLTWLVVWLNTIIPFDNLYRRAYFVMHTFLVFHVVFFFVFFVFVLSLVPNVACVSRLSILDCPLVFSNVYCVQYGMVEIISCIFCPVLLWKML